MSLDPYKSVEWYKNKYQYTAKYMTDFEIYEKLKQEFPDYDFQDSPFKLKKPDESPPDDWDAMKEDTQGYIEKMALWNVADKFADDSDFAARAYNNSIAGTIYQIKQGKMKYDVNMTTAGWHEDVGQFFLGLMSPLDAGLFLGSGGIGGIAAKGFLGTVNDPTLFLTGESGPEDVLIQPRRDPSQQTTARRNMGADVSFGFGGFGGGGGITTVVDDSSNTSNATVLAVGNGPHPAPINDGLHGFGAEWVM